eukprot:TRINITY_DN15896_c0_g1_i2.p1 TRINITY_DN15896_c0_g1~~TRINITY_DN15896_c0_g1_i2.p1  ORF type:complete len:407 (+),score=57.35 TRINITY_DN15896_c0_g1_i2:82-1302(+)
MGSLKKVAVAVLALGVVAIVNQVWYTTVTVGGNVIGVQEKHGDDDRGGNVVVEELPPQRDRGSEAVVEVGTCSAPAGGSLLHSGDSSHCKLAWLQSAGNTASCVPNTTLSYIRDFVSMAVTTGSGDGFFRADLGLCTWMYHVPASSLYFFTDKAYLAEGRRGNWVEDVLPEGVTFTKEQVEAKGYSLPWIKAQFRFLFGLKYIIKKDREEGTRKRWFLLLDDDTFVNLDGLVVKLKELDRQKSGKGRYLGERGWGGAGHLFDRTASEVLLQKIDGSCIIPYMVKSFHASDVTLQKCAPQIGLKPTVEYTMSHCGASFLRNRMLTGRQVTMHVKRDMVKPDMLAAWRMRLYYQVVYHRNITAFKLLMKVCNCAYGSCKNTACLGGHDKTAMEIFLEHSKNQTVMPDL